ncbi:MAG: glycosyltransferase family 2 protein [Candidatus Riflebacteria bacterium]|nr:glycosyltransferase family 2 protein [Candidatus Riflebacteria bacterium]
MKISLIVPCYNESEVLGEFFRRVNLLAEKLASYEFEFLFVNDGSTDSTAEILNSFADKDLRVKVLHFARNQGHQISLTAGMDFASGDYIVTIDADLQDPPEVIPEMIEKMSEGYQVIHAQRRTRAGETGFKLFTAWLFYQVMCRFLARDIVPDSGDFRAFTRQVMKVIRGFREKHRFLRGTFAVVGFKQCIVKYDRDSRFAGETKYPVKKMIKLAADAVLSFSSSPIRAITWLSLLLWSSSLIYLVKALIEKFILHETVQGWTSIIFLLTFFTGLNLFCLGIIGSYIGRIFEQGQKRPLYWLSNVRNVKRNEIDPEISDFEEVKIADCIFSEGPEK